MVLENSLKINNESIKKFIVHHEFCKQMYLYHGDDKLIQNSWENQHE